MCDQLPNEEPHAHGDGIFMEHGVVVGGGDNMWSCVFKIRIFSKRGIQCNQVFVFEISYKM